MPVGFPAKTTYANGDVFSADDINSTNGTLNLLTSAQFAAGKNKIINGDFYVNQRNFSSVTTAQYMFDRWSSYLSDGTVTYSAQTFTSGAAPVTGYEGKNYIRCVTTGQTLASAAAILIQSIEDVRTFAGQTVTLSFWAKSASGTPKIALELKQGFGTGGSPSADVFISGGTVTISTSWTRYSATIAVPSISGKTIGSNNDSQLALDFWFSAGSTFNTRASSIGIQTNTFDIWGVQVEAGSTATAFQTATGTIQGELAACQRYYYRTGGNAGASAYGILGYGQAYATTGAYCHIPLPTTMRVKPTTIDISALSTFWLTDGVATFVPTNIVSDTNVTNQNTAVLVIVGSGFSQYRFYQTTANNTGSGYAYIGMSAEL